MTPSTERDDEESNDGMRKRLEVPHEVKSESSSSMNRINSRCGGSKIDETKTSKRSYCTICIVILIHK